MPDLVIDTARATGRIWTPRSRLAPSNDGLLFTLTTSHPARPTASSFTDAAFNCRCDAVAALTEHGQVIGLELQHNRYTLLKRGGATGVCVAYSSTVATELFVGLSDGSIDVIDTEKRLLVGTLRGHRHAIRSLSCHRTQPLLLLTCSADAVVLWHTRTLARVLHLTANVARPLVCAVLTPSGEHVLTCFEQEVRVWRSADFAAVATFRLPAAHSTVRLRTLCVNESSSTVVATGDAGVIALWSLRTHELLKLLQLPSGSSVSQAIWMPASDHVALICDDGALRVVLPAADELSLELRPTDQRAKGSGFLRVVTDVLGHSLAAVRTDGSLALHTLEALGQHAVGHAKPPAATARLIPALTPRSVAPPHPALAHQRASAQPLAASGGGGPAPHTDFFRAPLMQGATNLAQLLPLYQLGSLPASSSLLHVDRLRGVLRHVGRFPDKHRALVWRFLLQLPGNASAHRGLADKGTHSAHATPHARSSLRNRRLRARLERALSCLAHWCPLLGEAADLDSAVFPWLLAFEGDELAGFEASATVLSNWGQVRSQPPFRTQARPPLDPTRVSFFSRKHAFFLTPHACLLPVSISDGTFRLVSSLLRLLRPHTCVFS